MVVVLPVVVAIVVEPVSFAASFSIRRDDGGMIFVYFVKKAYVILIFLETAAGDQLTPKGAQGVASPQ